MENCGESGAFMSDDDEKLDFFKLLSRNGANDDDDEGADDALLKLVRRNRGLVGDALKRWRDS